MKKTKATKITAQQMREALLRRFPDNEWAVVYECGCCVGGGGRGDMVAMNMWHSRGLQIHGVEIKVSRGDWLRELKQPNKAEGLFCYCDHWWLAVSDKSIIKDGELPPTWGLLVYTNSGSVRCVVAAPKLTPQPVDRAFVGELLRRSAADLKNKLSEARYEARQEAEEQRETHEQKRTREELEALRESLGKFKAASGIDINGWNGGSLGKAIKELADLRGYRDPTEFRAHSELQSARDYLQREVRAMDDALERLQKMHEVAAKAPLPS